VVTEYDLPERPRKKAAIASGLVYNKSFMSPLQSWACFLVLVPRAMPWAIIFRPFGAEGKLLYGSGLIGNPYTATLKLI
jgi:hypothetical protein